MNEKNRKLVIILAVEAAFFILIVLLVIYLFGNFQQVKSELTKPSPAASVTQNYPTTSSSLNPTPVFTSVTREEFETPAPSPSSLVESDLPRVGDSIQLIGDEACFEQTDQAFDLLKERALEYYNFVNERLGIIECIEQGSGVYTWENPPRFTVGKSTREAGTMWYAGVLVHESEHVELYRQGKEDSGKEAEEASVDVQYDALVQLGADQATLDDVKESLQTEWWNMDYEDRWW